jgi:hypothetical protein
MQIRQFEIPAQRIGQVVVYRTRLHGGRMHRFTCREQTPRGASAWSHHRKLPPSYSLAELLAFFTSSRTWLRLYDSGACSGGNLS